MPAYPAIAGLIQVLGVAGLYAPFPVYTDGLEAFASPFKCMPFLPSAQFILSMDRKIEASWPTSQTKVRCILCKKGQVAAFSIV